MSLNILVAQLNPIVGDIAGNASQLRKAIERGVAEVCDLVVAGELAISGYPPEDLLGRSAFIDDCSDAVDELATATPTGSMSPLVLVGAPRRVAPTRTGDAEPRSLANSVIALAGGGRVGAVDKQLLPNYSVFDEQRWFAPGEASEVFEVGGHRVGVVICEDMWQPAPADLLAAQGAELLIVVNASPWHRGKVRRRVEILIETADRIGMPVLYINQVGGQDGLVFDGNSMLVRPHLGVTWQAPAFDEHVAVVPIPLDAPTAACETGSTGRGVDDFPPKCEPAELWSALVLGLRDYLTKNGFDRAVLGVSGGIDSTIVATIAADALGAENVLGIAMPGPHSSPLSEELARDLAGRLGIAYTVSPIGAAYQAVMGELTRDGGLLAGSTPDVTEENLQSRLRGLTVMAVSNKQGQIPLACGNRSEVATGYYTLYGDSNGGFAPIADVGKQLVYELARWRNTVGDTPVIPEGIIDRAPTAELAPNQLDQDSLPPYAILDEILERYLEDGETADEIVDAGFAPEQVLRVLGLVDRAEFKRRQLPPSVRVTRQAFVRERRVPITNRWRATVRTGPS